MGNNKKYVVAAIVLAILFIGFLAAYANEHSKYVKLENNYYDLKSDYYDLDIENAELKARLYMEEEINEKVFCELTSFSKFTGVPNSISIIAEPYLVRDVETDEWIENSMGLCFIAWEPGTKNASFIAIARKDNKSYTFILNETLNETLRTAPNGEIRGRWDVIRDGSFVCRGCIGKAYGLDEEIGSYLKVYIGDQRAYHEGEGWHFSGRIIHKIPYK